MKKFVAVLSAAAMMTSLAACGFTADTANTAASSAETTASAAESTADTAAADSYKSPLSSSSTTPASTRSAWLLRKS